LVHNGVADSFLECVDFLLDFAYFLTKIRPFDLGELDFFEVLVESAFVFGWVFTFSEVEFLECLN
jgi:hypothetical protein